MTDKEPKDHKKTNFSFQYTQEQGEKMARLLGFAVSNAVKCQMGTVVRALIEGASADIEFLGIIRRLAEDEKAQWLEKRGLSHRGPTEKEANQEKTNFSFQYTQEQGDKMSMLLAFAVSNGVNCQMGTVVRGLIEGASDDIEFLGIVRRLAEDEKAQWLEKRGIKPNDHN